MHRFSVIACARWETPYIAEWLAYYAAIGFDHIYLYCNDDDPSEFAGAVAAATRDRPGFVSFTHFPGQGLQREMYVDALVRARRESEWIAFFDIDEFLVLRGFDDIGLFMEQFDVFTDSVHFNWVYFGNSGFVHRPAGSVLRQYVRRAPEVNAHTKHITRAEVLDPERLGRHSTYPFWHGLTDPAWTGVKRVNVLGVDVGPQLASFPDSTARYLTARGVNDAILSRAVVNHYAFKSEDDFLFRVRRGTGGEFSSQSDWQQKYESGYFRLILESMDQTEDTYLSAFSARMLPDIAPVAPAAGLLPPVQTIHALHRLWSGDLMLGANGRVRHLVHGSLGAYSRNGARLRVKWDDWPDEDVFDERDGVFVGAGRELSTQAAALSGGGPS